LLVPVLQGAFDDPGKAAGPVIAALSNQPDAIAVTLDAKAVAVVFDLVEPVVAGGNGLAEVAGRTRNAST